ncbi:DNA-binding MarR family transcriptional regulator [Actinoplanes campanulatus]|uniref:DNA-binding MarR family transcriptional regulator n=1 Tax=Actinoplanes campanulatus TaxID=113559 RepID=A0A7W5AD94_9ACTN|nr:MarR family transcriptional regulator [Actinoplanes campanulatus]MBB3093860.1 DNA-binding MarR family transcriptional regulator [Actinoplanes campanulatus]
MSKQSPVTGRWGSFPPAAPQDSGPRQAAADAAAAFGAAADEVDDAAAAALHVNRTDLRIIGLIGAAGAMTAGTLAEAAHLSPAATTAAIQRLVAAGHLRRDTDPADRRRAVVTVTPATAEAVGRIYGPIAEAGHRLLTGYSDADLELITGFLEAGRRMQVDQADRIRTHPAR